MRTSVALRLSTISALGLGLLLVVPGIIGIRVDPVVHTGDRVAYVAHEWTEVAP